MSEKLEDIVVPEKNSKNNNSNTEDNKDNLNYNFEKVKENYDYTRYKKELEIKHTELNFSQKKWIVRFILGYAVLVFIFTVSLVMYIKNYHGKLNDIFIFLENCPYFLVFIIALLLVPVWCLTSIAKAVFKVKQNEDNVIENKALFDRLSDVLSNIPNMHG